jgi:AAA+ superfamily predicted ATPase
MTVSQTWIESNQKYLAANIDNICFLLKKYIEEQTLIGSTIKKEGEDYDQKSSLSSLKSSSLDLTTQAAVLPEWTEDSPPALETICSLFGLSIFEKSVLLLCAGAELNSKLGQMCAKAHGNVNNTYPTIGLALAALPSPHWSALTPVSPLRAFKLIDLYNLPNMQITSCPLRIEERVLHYLVGISYLEKDLQTILRPVGEKTLIMTDSHKELAKGILRAFQDSTQKNKRYKDDESDDGQEEISLPSVQLWGKDEISKLSIAKWICDEIGIDLWYLPGEIVPVKSDELQYFIQLWARESALSSLGLYISAEDIDEPAAQKPIRRLVQKITGPVFIGTTEPWSMFSRFNLVSQVKKPSKLEQHRIWNVYLKGEGEQDHHQYYSSPSFATVTNGLEIANLVNQFDLNASAIQRAVTTAAAAAAAAAGGVTTRTEKFASVKVKLNDDNNNNNSSLFSALWDTCRKVARPKMSGLAQQIITKAKMDDLVLPVHERQLLYYMIVHLKQRYKVYDKWGYESINGNRGLGVSALFFGESGTGKTMAAEVLANELNLDLFRIDLSMVVSKYIGETEKNLGKVFDGAEDGGSILFFDEADALFGKRSEIHDSHDRYANIEVGYLLQKMEAYRGVAILATNTKNALDPAFIRRIRFIVKFPFPDEKNREQIWSRIFPPATPTNGLDIHRLAKLNITGGHIRNIALNASFLAADQDIPVNMDHIKRAAQLEYNKLERPLTSTEIGDW